MNQKLKNIIFDLDGTLIDSQASIFNSVAHTLSALGLDKEVKAREMKNYIGLSLKDAFKNLLIDADEALVEKACKVYREYYEVNALNHVAVFFGIEKVLLKLKSLNYQLYVATFKSENSAKYLIKELGLEKFFNSIYGPNNYSFYQNKAQIVEKLILDEFLEPAETMMIGDHTQDVQAGKENKLLFSLGVAYGNSEENELKQAGADFICQDAFDLLRFLNIVI